jgi:hypothetical protein
MSVAASTTEDSTTITACGVCTEVSSEFNDFFSVSTIPASIEEVTRMLSRIRVAVLTAFTPRHFVPAPIPATNPIAQIHNPTPTETLTGRRHRKRGHVIWRSRRICSRTEHRLETSLLERTFTSRLDI